MATEADARLQFGHCRSGCNLAIVALAFLVGVRGWLTLPWTVKNPTPPAEDIVSSMMCSFQMGNILDSFQRRHHQVCGPFLRSFWYLRLYKGIDTK